MRTKLKMVRVSLDTDTYIVVWTTTHLRLQLRGLNVGAEFDYVAVRPAGSGRKYVVASELLCRFSENWLGNAEVLATYQGKELNHTPPGS